METEKSRTSPGHWYSALAIGDEDQARRFGQMRVSYSRVPHFALHPRALLTHDGACFALTRRFTRSVAERRQMKKDAEKASFSFSIL